MFAAGKAELFATLKDFLTDSGGRSYREVAAQLGNYPELARDTLKAIPMAKLIPLENVGHVPHLEAPGVFHDSVTQFLLEPLPIAEGPGPVPVKRR